MENYELRCHSAIFWLPVEPWRLEKEAKMDWDGRLSSFEVFKRPRLKENGIEIAMCFHAA